MSSTLSSSSQQTAQKLKELLVEIPNNDRADAARLDELRRILARLVVNEELVFPSNSSTSSSNISTTNKQKWNTFLQQCHRQVVGQLCAKITQQQSSPITTAVRCLWGVLASSPQRTLQPDYYTHVHTELLYTFWSAILLAPDVLHNKTIQTMLQQEILDRHLDVQYYTYGCVTRLSKELYHMKKDDKDHAERILDLLLMIPVVTTQSELDNMQKYLFPPPPMNDDAKDSDVDDSDSSASDDESDSSASDSEEDEPDDDQKAVELQTKPSKSTTKKNRKKSSCAFAQLQTRKKALLDAWLAVLKLPLPRSALKQALQILPKSILPTVSHPLRFADFMTQAYQSESGIVSLLALDGLFVLMTRHGLEYPMFYKSLYGLVAQPSLLYAKYRVRYFELLAKCLMRNEMLPAYLVSAFMKRLLRSALSAPPTASLFCLALTSNLLRKHPECACLIHREGHMEQDPFDANTLDPTEARALESSLWELSALSKHYYPAVATLARSIGTEDGPLHNMDDFVRYTYKSLFDQERSTKRRRLSTPVTFVEPKSLFDEKDVFAGTL